MDTFHLELEAPDNLAYPDKNKTRNIMNIFKCPEIPHNVNAYNFFKFQFVENVQTSNADCEQSIVAINSS